MEAGQFTDGALALKFILAGNARFTLVSKKTGTRFTFRVSQPKENGPHFVSILSGPNNEADYQFMGTIFDSRDYRPGKKSRIGQDAPSAKAFRWAWAFLSGGILPITLEVYHEGRCGRCGKPLTTPESVTRGIGPICEGKE